MAKTTTRVRKVSLDLDISLLEEIDSIRGQGVSRTREGVRSATDGSGMIDGIVREYLTPKNPPKLDGHLVLNRARIGLYMDEPLHVKARNVAYTQRISLSALLANVIAARFAPERERAA